jgi:hypothetical protein
MPLTTAGDWPRQISLAGRGVGVRCSMGDILRGLSALTANAGSNRLINDHTRVQIDKGSRTASGWWSSRVLRWRNSIKCGRRASNKTRVEDAKFRTLSKWLARWHTEPCLCIREILKRFQVEFRWVTQSSVGICRPVGWRDRKFARAEFGNSFRRSISDANAAAAVVEFHNCHNKSRSWLGGWSILNFREAAINDVTEGGQRFELSWIQFSSRLVPQC